MEIQEIISKLEYYDGTFPREALEAAIEKKEEIIPKLLEFLELTIKEAEEFRDETEFQAHIFAMFLLAEFREKKAFPLLLDFFSLPDDAIWDLTGDIVTESLSGLFASTYDGDISKIHQLIENEDIDEFVRAAALDSLLVLLKFDSITRESIVEYFDELFRGGLKSEIIFLWSHLVECSINIYPEELYEILKEFLSVNLLGDDYYNLVDVEQALEEDKETVLQRLKEDDRFYLIDDAMEEIPHWLPEDEEIAVETIEDINKRMEMHGREPVRVEPKIGRNEPCPCGSGKKYKKCCGKKS